MNIDIGPNLTTVLMACIVAAPALIAAIFARRAANTTADVSSRIDGRLDAVVTAAHAQGVLAGQAQPHVDPQALAIPPIPGVNGPPKDGQV